jgi:hypothetical protein
MEQTEDDNDRNAENSPENQYDRDVVVQPVPGLSEVCFHNCLSPDHIPTVLLEFRYPSAVINEWLLNEVRIFRGLLHWLAYLRNCRCQMLKWQLRMTMIGVLSSKK